MGSAGSREPEMIEITRFTRLSDVRRSYTCASTGNATAICTTSIGAGQMFEPPREPAPRGSCRNCAAPSTGWVCDYCGGWR